jgi:hypothetical protein
VSGVSALTKEQQPPKKVLPWRAYRSSVLLVIFLCICLGVAYGVPRPFGPEVGILGAALWFAAMGARTWRSSQPSLERPAFAPGTSRGWRATFRTAIAFFAPLPITVALLCFSLSQRTSGGVHRVLHDTSLAFGWGAIVLVVLGVSVYFFNRPSFAVPPAYRTLPGLVHEWRLALKGQSAIDEWKTKQQRGD